jgi:hypothetical protein
MTWPGFRLFTSSTCTHCALTVHIYLIIFAHNVTRLITYIYCCCAVECVKKIHAFEYFSSAHTNSTNRNLLQQQQLLLFISQMHLSATSFIQNVVLFLWLNSSCQWMLSMFVADVIIIFALIITKYLHFIIRHISWLFSIILSDYTQTRLFTRIYDEVRIS